jgi:hypothetical protein
VTFRRSRRASALLLSWNGATGWNADGKPVTVNGVVGTFTRNGIKTAVDRQGRVYVVPAGRPAQYHRYNATTGLYEYAGVLLERAGTNLCLHSDDFTNAAWAKGTGITVTGNDAVAPDGTTTADRINNDASLASQSANQAIAFTGDGEKCAAVYLKAGTATQTDLLLHDSTAAVTRHGINVAWSGGVPTPSTQAGSGTIYPVERLVDGWWRIPFSATGIVAANNNRLNIYPTGTGQLAGNVYAWRAQAEDAVIPSSGIATAAATAARVADFLEFPVLWLPRDCTIYCDHVDYGTFQTTGAVLLNLGQDGAAIVAAIAYITTANPAAGDVVATYGHLNPSPSSTGSTISTGAVAIGDRQEIRFPVLDTGFAASRSINGAAEVFGTTANAITHDTAYHEPRLNLTPGGPSGNTFGGAHAMRAVKIATNEPTMAQLRSAA